MHCHRNCDSSQHIDFTYDALNRPTLKNLPGSEADVTFAYDNLGRLASATDATGEYVSFGYDALGRRLSETTPRGTVQTGYDLANQRVLSVCITVTRAITPFSHYGDTCNNPFLTIALAGE